MADKPLPEGYLAELVRTSDMPRYLACLYAPADRRQDLFALYAFVQEIARIPYQVSEPQLGEIRLQWWHETLNVIEQGERISDHPVAQSLAATIKKYNLPLPPFHRLIDAHTHDLYDEPFAGQQSLESYLGDTYAAPMQMACLILGGSAPDIAGFGGIALGLSRNAQKQSSPEMTSLALERLGQARAAAKSHPDFLKLLPVFLPLALVESDIASPPRHHRLSASRYLKLWWAARHNRF